MANYEVKVTASWWIDVVADDETEAESIAIDQFLDNGIYDGVDSVKVHEGAEDDEE